MSLKYVLVENLLTPAVDDYTAQTQQTKSNDLDSIIQKMLKRGSMLTKTDILAVLNGFFEVCEEITQDGETINTDLIKTHLTISGVFIGATDSYDAKRHSININVTAGKLLKNAISEMKTEKLATAEILPNILEVKDSVSQTTNDQLTSNGVLEIMGSRLKIEGAEGQEVGIFFVNEEDNTSYKVATIVDNKPAKLIVMIPALPKGQYTLQVKTAYTGATPLKQARMGVFNKPLQVI